MNLEEIVKMILEKTKLMSLGTLDENGVWVSDVIFVNDEKFNIYWFGRKETRHSKAILKNPKVAATITLTHAPSEPNMGIQLEGIAKEISGEQYELAIKHWAKRNKLTPKHGDILDEGESWYILTPTKIEVFYEPLFGFNRQKFL